MPEGRYVLLGLAQARAPWFKELSQWTTSSSIAAEFVKCVSAEEVRVHLASGRPYSALLIDASLAAFDRDLVATSVDAGTPVLVVTDGRGPPWTPDDLGVSAVLPAGFARSDLLAALGAHTALVSDASQLPPILEDQPAPLWRGHMLTVCGPGGTGASTVAVALAQGLAGDPRHGGRILLADLALRADQALLHDARDLGPGLQELVEAHRLGRPAPSEIRAGTFEVPSRGYRLLLGLRRPAAWSVLRPKAIDVTLDGLRRTFQVVVADVGGDVEGESESGSADVEERNHLARSATSTADAVVIVGAPGLKGLHSLGSLMRSLHELGVSPGRMLPVVNRAPRHPRARSDITAALGVLLPGIADLPGPVFLPERKVDGALRDNEALPSALVEPLTRAVMALVDRQADAPPPGHGGPVPVAPGSLGRWTESAPPNA
ncbi:MAG: hypothetical protein ACR2KC_03010 [Acidimicrobiales bacterium]